MADIDGLSPNRRAKLGTIVENAGEHLRLGLDLLGRVDLIDDRSAPILTLLSIGTEHLLKATWATAVSHRSGSLPAENELRELGHSITRAHDYVVGEARHLSPPSTGGSICSPTRAIEWRDEDLAWMNASTDLAALLGVLEDYGTAGRYTDFAVVLDDSSPPDPKRACESALERLWSSHNKSAWSEAKSGTSEEFLHLTSGYHEESARLARATLGRYYRSIGRWWWCGLLGDTARMYSATALHSFLVLPPTEVA